MDLMNFTPKIDDIVVELVLKKPDGTELPITNEDGTPMTITVMAPFDKRSKEIVSRLNEERIAIATKKGDKKISLNDAEETFIKTLVETTVDWNITWGGEKPVFNKELAKDVYEKAFWIRTLVEEAKAKTLDFMQA